MAQPARIILALHLTSSYARGVLRGVVHYVRSCPERPFHFDVVPLDQLDGKLNQPGSSARGVICDISTPEMVQTLKKSSCPVINVGDCHPTDLFPQVTSDNTQIGEKAAEYLIHRGVERFGYIGLEGYAFSAGRYRAFEDCLRRAGHGPVQVYPGSKELGRRWSWAEHRQKLGQWALSLPRPVGVLSCVDTGAKTLVQGALSAGIPIPDQLLIVGVGNDEIECELADVSLSSVALAEERIGYEAASLLHNMLQGQPAPDKPVHISPSGVVVRDSSDTVVFADPQLSAAVRYIHEHVADSIKVTDVLPVVSLSRRELERRFAAQLGHSPHAEIRYSQLNRAKELLAQSDLPMSQVALAAGFKESKRLSVVFRQETGMSPSEYRWEFRCASETPEGTF